LEIPDADGKTPNDFASDDMKAALSEIGNANELLSPAREVQKFEHMKEGLLHVLHRLLLAVADELSVITFFLF
jgi:hypothetical protein